MGLFKRTAAEEVASSIREHVESLTRTADPSAGLVKVSVFYTFEGEYTPSEYIVAVHQLEKFLLATLELHYNPGHNPHNRNKAAPVQLITTAVMKPAGPYWWSTPGLQENYDSDGVVIFNWDIVPNIAWLRPGAELPSSLKTLRR